MTFTDDLELATRLARQAGGVVRSLRARAIAHPTMKADHSPVTEADLAADAVIREGLASLGDLVVTEESWHGASIGSGRVWCVDPIDGTEDFVAGRADYVVQIGLVIDGAPVLGVVYQPETGALWRGVVAERRCERVDDDGRVRTLRVDDRALPRGPVRLAVSVSHPSRAVSAVLDELGATPVPRGSVGLKVALIIEDEADAYATISRRIKVWDTAAPAAILLAAGGVVTAIDGTPLEYRGGAAHLNGALMWTQAARNALAARVETALERYLGSRRS